MAERFQPAPWQRRRRLPEALPIAAHEPGPRKRSPYQQGRDFERAVRGRLERRGFYVMRSAMSKGTADLLAVGSLCVACGISALFVQAKRRFAIGSGEWNELCELAWRFDGWPVLAGRESARTVSFYRLDALREPRRPGRPWTLIDVRDLSELHPPQPLLIRGGER